MKEVKFNEEKMIKDIADNIKSISKSVQKILDGELEEKAIILLLANSSGLPQSTVKRVLYSIYNMEQDFVKDAK